MNNAKRGFTLAELLVALALLAVIATFTIPKVLNATGNRSVPALVRETVASMEESYYSTITDGSQLQTLNFYNFVTPKLNTVRASNTAAVNAAGNPFCVGAAPCIAAAHPCSAAGSVNGWIQFSNGVVVTGLSDGAANVQTAGVTPICIDVDGANGQNTDGVDIFSGQFDFTNANTAQKFDWNTAIGGGVTTAASAQLTN